MDWQKLKALAEIYKKLGTRKSASSTLRANYEKGVIGALTSCDFLKNSGSSVFLSKEGLLAGKQAERTIAVLKIFCTKILGLTTQETQIYLQELVPHLTPHLLEKYCSLIGHGHAHNITTGVCCEQARIYNAETVMPLSRLPLNTPASVVYVQTALQPSLVKLYDLGIHPGRTIRIKQLYPAYILSTEQGKVALDSALAKFIFVQKT